MTTALSLIALVLGYRALIAAYTQKDGLKILGQVVGIFVMIAAVLVFLMRFCPVYGSGYGAYKCAKTGYSQPLCPLSKK